MPVPGGYHFSVGCPYMQPSPSHSKTGEDKYLVLLGIVSLLRGVVFVMGPLHGLGTDQANKSKQTEKGIEAYHVNEFGEADLNSFLCRVLLKTTKNNNTALVIYISPQALSNPTQACNDMELFLF